MRLLLVNYEYPPVGGGAATATQALSRCFNRLGHEVTILTGGFGDRVGETNEDGARVIRLKTGRARTDRASMAEMWRYLCRATLALGVVCRRARPDTAIVFFSIPCGPLGLLLRLRYNVPYVVSLRGGDVPGFLPELDRFHAVLAPVRRWTLRRSQAVVANSPSLVQLARQADGGTVAMIPNGVDTDLFCPRSDPSPRNTFRFIFVGRLTPQKRLALAFRAFKRLSETHPSPDSFRLCVVGDGPLRAELEETAAQLGITSRIEWQGWVSRERLRDLYRNADCLLHTSNIEGMSNTVLEGMATGLPIISSDGPGNCDIVIHGENGLVFPVDDEDALLQGMISVASDKTLFARLGKGSRQRALSHHSWMAAAHAYLRLILPDADRYSPAHI